MLAGQLMDLRSMLHKQGVIFAYSGYVTEPVLSGVGEALKQKLTIDDADTKTLRSVFAIFVEQMQNIIRYSAEMQHAPPPASDANALKEIRYGILTIRKEGVDYIVCAGNLVRQTDVERLRERLSRIRDMNKDELKAHYKEKLRADPEEGSKGAGLGFMEIARRATQPIEFDFVDVDADYSFFALKATILGLSDAGQAGYWADFAYAGRGFRFLRQPPEDFRRVLSRGCDGVLPASVRRAR